jgi:hypothetical protein
MVVYRIAKWREVFEKSESRKLKVPSWVSLPIAFGSSGYHSLLDEFGDDAAAIYGCWCSLLLVSAGCNVRGMLADSRGNPLRITWIARTTGFPVTLFERLVAWAASDEIGWLERLEAEDVQAAIAENQVISTETSSLGESPTHPPEVWGKSRATRQDKTGQDKTSHNKTRQDKTPGEAPVEDVPGLATELAAVGSLVGVASNPNLMILKDRWDRLRMDEKFLESVIEIAKKLKRISHPAIRAMSKRQVLEYSWAGTDFDPNVLQGCIERIATRQVEKPLAYLDGAFRKLCNEKSQCRWDDVRTIVPNPPTSQPASVTEPQETEAA